jgi:hypothetical protein
MKRYRNINIEVVSNGFIGTVGCQRVIAESTDKVLELLKKYFDDPVLMEKDLFENHLSLNQPVPAPGQPETVRGTEPNRTVSSPQCPPPIESERRRE